MKKSSFLLTALVSGCFLLSGYAGHAQSSFDLVTAKKQIEEANKSFTESIAKGDAATVANMYSSDAKFMGANSPSASGKQEIQTVIGGLIASGATQLVLSTVGVWGDAKLLAEEGTFTIAMKDGTSLDKGKYIVLWKKEDGKWKIFRDCFNSDMPMPGMK
jgi:uncharacterized protein (TIGR02246 family)